MKGAEGPGFHFWQPGCDPVEVDEAATRIREEVDDEANIILGATFDNALEGTFRVSVVATGIDHVDSADTAGAFDSGNGTVSFLPRRAL